MTPIETARKILNDVNAAQSSQEELVVKVLSVLPSYGWTPPPTPRREVHYDRSVAYKEEDLVYAAYSRCKCGAGMAYLKDSWSRGFWACSAQLKHEAADNVVMVASDVFASDLPDFTHSPALMFAFWDMKSELQPSAHGVTTRPK